MEPKLSILICRMPSRYAMWGRLLTELWSQILPYSSQVQMLSDDRMSVTVGEKRNRLVNDAAGTYLAMIDDDDWICPNYIDLLMKAADTGCDCASLKGEITIDGINPDIFEHSLKYDAWKTNPPGSEIRHERFPNHLNMIRSSIAKQIKYPEKNFGEDFDWSTLLHESGLLKTEHYIPEVIYYYRYISKK